MDTNCLRDRWRNQHLTLSLAQLKIRRSKMIYDNNSNPSSVLKSQIFTIPQGVQSLVLHKAGKQLTAL